VVRASRVPQLCNQTDETGGRSAMGGPLSLRDARARAITARVRERERAPRLHPSRRACAKRRAPRRANAALG